MRPLHCADRAAWRRWLTRNAAREPEVWLRYYKKGTGKATVSYEDAVEEALCFGWIDSTVRALDAESYVQRFTPRRPRSRWTQRNIDRVVRLERLGLMTPAGRAAFAGHESRVTAPLPTVLPPELVATFAPQDRAWTAFNAFPPSYRRMAIAWVASAKQDATRRRRLVKLIEHSARAERIKFM